MAKAPHTKQEALDAFKAKKEGHSHALQNRMSRAATAATAAEAVELRQLTQAGETGLRRTPISSVTAVKPGHRALFELGLLLDRAEAELRRVQALIAAAHGVPRGPSNRLHPNTGREGRDHDDDDASDPKTSARTASTRAPFYLVRHLFHRDRHGHSKRSPTCTLRDAVGESVPGWGGTGLEEMCPTQIRHLFALLARHDVNSVSV
jgi:hypothetical protein